MDKFDSRVLLAKCQNIFTNRLNTCISRYAQYGTTLPVIEGRIQRGEYAAAKTGLQACLANHPDAELPIVNPNGDLAIIMRDMVHWCDCLINNQILTEKLQNIKPESENNNV